MDKIRIHNISKSYAIPKGDLLVLDDISLNVKEGEFISVLGPSGCGKTTLLRILAGIETYQGKIETEYGKSHKVSFVWQQGDLLPWLNVEENIELGLKRIERDRKKRKAIIDYCLNAVGLGEFNKYYAFQLSGGMQKRASIARALSVSPEIILMDEPFAFLDYHMRTRMHALLINLYQKECQTIVFVTHDIHEAIKLSKRIVVLSSLPGSIKEIIDVPFLYPRDFEAIVREDEYRSLVNKLQALLKDEMDKTPQIERNW